MRQRINVTLMMRPLKGASYDARSGQSNWWMSSLLKDCNERDPRSLPNCLDSFENMFPLDTPILLYELN